MRHLSTGGAARLIGTTDPHLADLVRRGKVTPEPTVFAGRRMWTATHVRQAAEHLGVLTPEVERAIAAAFTPGEVSNAS